MKKIVCIIPARGGSKGIPKKNIIELGGKPLLVHSIEIAQKCDAIQDIYVSSDSNEILSIAEKHGAIPIFCPLEYAHFDLSTDRHVLIHAIDETKNYLDIIYLRPTCPMRKVETINKAIEFFYDNYDKCTSLIGVQETSPAQKTFYKKGVYLHGHFSNLESSLGSEYFVLPRQTYLQNFKHTGYIDILKHEVLTQDGHCYGDKILAFETETVIDIDTYEDLEYIEYKMKKR